MGAKKEKPEELLTLDQAVEFVRNYYGLDKPPFSKGTLYNKISDKSLRRYGPRHCAMLDKEEILKKLCK